MGGGTREWVLDGDGGFRCRNCGGGIYKFTSFTLAYPTWKSTTKSGASGRGGAGPPTFSVGEA